MLTSAMDHGRQEQRHLKSNCTSISILHRKKQTYPSAREQPAHTPSEYQGIHMSSQLSLEALCRSFQVYLPRLVEQSHGRYACCISYSSRLVYVTLPLYSTNPHKGHHHLYYYLKYHLVDQSGISVGCPSPLMITRTIKVHLSSCTSS